MKLYSSAFLLYFYLINFYSSEMCVCLSLNEPHSTAFSPYAVEWPTNVFAGEESSLQLEHERVRCCCGVASDSFPPLWTMKSVDWKMLCTFSLHSQQSSAEEQHHRTASRTIRRKISSVTHCRLYASHNGQPYKLQKGCFSQIFWRFSVLFHFYPVESWILYYMSAHNGQ